jgi:uncharacterized protein DUF5916/cellulose/xylan binding protein with CBM9 domain
MKTRIKLLLLLVILLPKVSTAQETILEDIQTVKINSPKSLKKIYNTKAIGNSEPVLDGLFDEACWKTVGWSSGFTQREPYEGEKPSQETAFKILYDQKNIYVAFRCFDTEPEKIEKRLSRRDGFEGDWVEINIDSYFDKRTAFSFSITAAGVKGDEFISDDGNNWDSSWDPIWYVKTNSDEKGWTAEARIPLSQLRFGDKENHVWGIQVNRLDFRTQEKSNWQFVERNTSSWVGSFGELHGISGIKSQQQLEIMPYVLAQAETFEKVEGNPFATGSGQSLSVGLDGKIGVTSDLTLDFTINPDFGQVEADPSVVNLDGYQVFFEERRPFFIEGRNIFDYRVTSSEAGGPFGSDQLFYSRRVGGSPHSYPDLSDQEFAKTPNNTTILGAAKFTGKTKNGLSIGIMESITAKEFAEIDFEGERREEVIEPLSNYFVGRLQKDAKNGNTVFGGMFTAANRELDGTGLDFLHESAYTGGLDFLQRWNDKTWYASGNLVFSQVSGSTKAITNTQQSFERLYQREGANHLTIDTSLTSLFGHGGTLKLGKSGGGKRFNFDGGVTWRSPGLELNDIGFLRSTDYVVHFLWAGYRIDKAFSIFQQVRFNYNHWLGWDYGGLHTYHGWNVNAHARFKNNYGIGSGTNIQPYDISTSVLRGGPAMRMSPKMNNWMYAFSDQSKKVFTEFNMFHSWAFDQSAKTKDYSIFASYQPTKSLRITMGPGITIHRDDVQFVDNIDFGNTVRYVNGTINQKTLSMSLRLNYTIKPNLTIQYYGQPFISRGRYSDFKYISNPLESNAEDRYILFDEKQITYNSENEIYEVDENLDDVIDYEIGNPDFNFIQFRSNLVARWEYIPGSELFLVWSQGTTSFGDSQDKILPSLTENIFSQKAHNIFLVKCTYRFIK